MSSANNSLDIQYAFCATDPQHVLHSTAECETQCIINKKWSVSAWEVFEDTLLVIVYGHCVAVLQNI